MTKQKLTPELFEAILQRVPEGFLHRSVIHRRLRIDASSLTFDTAEAPVARDGEFFYLTALLGPEDLHERRVWMRPQLPALRHDNSPALPPISEQIAARERALPRMTSLAQTVMARIALTPGYLHIDDLNEAEREAVEQLCAEGFLSRDQNLVYDPLRLGSASIAELNRRLALLPLREALEGYLRARPGFAAPQQELVEQFGEDSLRELLALGGYARFSVSIKRPPYAVTWVRLREGDFQAAQAAAADAYRIHDDDWRPFLAWSGTKLRAEAHDSACYRAQVLARTYTISTAAKRLQLSSETLEKAFQNELLPGFVDPEGVIRFAAEEIDRAASETDLYESLADAQAIKPQQVALVCAVSYPTVRRRLRRSGLKNGALTWEQVRGMWELPESYLEFRAILRERLRVRRAERAAAKAKAERLEALAQQRRQQLRERLVASFPTWRHEGRVEQKMFLHIGPPNSGKTHDALEALAEAGQGWYLAPLRLLAFEVFDRLNQRGVRCNLLTGEEYIPVDGATITAATVEMFNPQRSGTCVIIDEAQLLADPDRGWAWTRALMEARSPVIHVVGPPTARELIERMATAVGLSTTIIKHERLAPVRVADRPWALQDLPERTILVAFSRQTVLELKIELERYHRRVSVIYGNLPPEVRRKQADRFADGETEIAIATDAVGMGLNLPADYVCFYDVRKFDGRQVRELSPAEVQQIGGRAGRYGLSQAGQIGATTEGDLRLIRKLFYAKAETLTHARIAPTVADLELIPGTLAERLAEWASLKSIPETLRGAIETADMDERIELARMLQQDEVERLGLAAALQLVNAPTRKNSREFWYACAQAIVAGQALPLPPAARMVIADSSDLELMETCIAHADIYLWLSCRAEFLGCAPDAEHVRALRAEWSDAIDNALRRRLVSSRRCARCGKLLANGHRYPICDQCFNAHHPRSSRARSSR
ncbi:MAG: helicase-related protein [Aggregatilineales bacterium]